MLLFVQFFLSQFDCLHDGCLTIRILVDADAKIDLVGSFIVAIAEHQGEDRIGGDGLQ